ncbi:unnamed protein product [Lactuca saligna]|uniref:Uncharacterized protein n=1 Tax=Lactuca saligna TaxID=75948 RepID=A0AA35ZVB0_LACSI|nr:unnamed protein product [Lactuca saligna]
MEELKKLNNDAYEWTKAIPPQHWSRSHFTATKTLEKIKVEGAEYRVAFCGNAKYHVTGGEGACPTKLLPPKHHVPIGRPKKKRRRSATEDDSARGTRTSRSSKCGNVRHNGRSYKGQVVGGSQVNGSNVKLNVGV